MKTNLQFAAVKSYRSALDPELAWQQLCERDAGAQFFYAVLTTGVFCRAACKSRRPLRENVRFFLNAADAQSAGFRPCQRCHPSAPCSQPLDKVRAHLEANFDRAVSLAELGRIAGMSPFTVQRTFKQQMGASPLQYQRSLRTGRLRGALKQGNRVTDAIYEAGFSSSSRAYEGAQLGMTPARFAQGGKGERIGWCSGPSPFGWIVVGSTERGLCWLSIAASHNEAEADLRAEFPLADLHHDSSLAQLVDRAIQSVREGDDLTRRGRLADSLDLRGTVFQLRVWQALQQIPRGETRSYSELARELGNAKATRAVARACATNRVALIVPCHRIVGARGSLTGYRWGVERKKALLEAERKIAN